LISQPSLALADYLGAANLLLGPERRHDVCQWWMRHGGIMLGQPAGKNPIRISRLSRRTQNYPAAGFSEGVLRRRIDGLFYRELG
jgi:hypothetical protein